jgi:cytochrome P450
MVPATDADLFSGAAIRDPHPCYRALRELGPAAWLTRDQVWAVAGYVDVYDVLHDHQAYSSAPPPDNGPAPARKTGRPGAGSLLTSDPPVHDQLRAIIEAPLRPRALKKLEGMVQARADALVDALAGEQTIDAITDFARVLPAGLVPDLLGWPPEGRGKLLACAAQQDVAGLSAQVRQVLADRGLAEDGWGGRLVRLSQDGQLADDLVVSLIIDYLAPSLDTTISALGTAIFAFGTHPGQWNLIRADPGLIPAAFNEVVRWESPVRGCTRTATRDHRIGDIPVGQGQQVLVLCGSANRDERQWDDPDRFDITRNAAAHLAFGHGIHYCLGQGLARLEVHCLLRSLAARVIRIEVGAPAWGLDNNIRAIAALPAVLHA